MQILEQIHTALIEAGFECRYTGQRNRYYGVLSCVGRNYPIWVEIADPDLIKHPRINLVERPAEIPKICAHIGPAGDICYSTFGRDVMNRYRPAEQIRACLREAENVLCKALQGDCLDDTREEFASYWFEDLILIADIATDREDERVDMFELSRNGKRVFYLAAKDATTYERAGYTVKPQPIKAYITTTNTLPIASHDNWPPRTLGQLSTWLKSIDNGRLNKAWSNALFQYHGHRDDIGVAMLVRTPGAWWGVLLDQDLGKRNTFKQSPSRWMKYVRNHCSKKPIKRLSVERGDPDHLVNRNLAGRTGLSGKRILLAGCGTIGGYLAVLLARAGGGASGGELVIADNDFLKPGNIGRHFLGLDSLFKPKATGMAETLHRTLPHHKVNALECDVREINLNGFDLIIDATGSEGLSLTLNDRLLQQGYSTPAVFVWNEGNGVASQCLLVDSPKTACFRCLSDENGRPRFSPLMDENHDPFVMGIGCDTAYVPYPAMVSMQAAAMASSLILDWADGCPGKRLRTLLYNHQQGKAVKDTNPKRHSRCPACS